MQFLAVVPNQKYFCFPEWPMERNAGHKMFTRFYKVVHIVGNFHGVALQIQMARRKRSICMVEMAWRMALLRMSPDAMPLYKAACAPILIAASHK